KKKLAKVHFAYQRLPAWLRQRVPTVKDSTTEIAFENGSSIQVGTSHRGGTLQILHVSEYGKISALAPDKAKEIKTGAFGTVHAGQFIHVESTAEGTGGEFYDLVQEADARQKEGHALSPLDFRLHFFPWHGHHGYRLPADTSLPGELIDYFAEIKGKHGIELTPEQKAWYAAKRRQIGPDEMLREYPSVPDEAFYASLEGTYFKQQMSKARIEGPIAIGPHDENRKVNAFWDIGNDTTTIWFHQSDGVRHRLIDYYENSGEQIAHYCNVLQEKQLKRGFAYGRHFGPHDFGVTDWGGDGKTRKDRASALGIEIDIVPRVEDKADAIEEARSFLNACWIDTKHCERGVADRYRANSLRGPDEMLREYPSVPDEAFYASLEGTYPNISMMQPG